MVSGSAHDDLSRHRFLSAVVAAEEVEIAIASHFHDTWREPRWQEDSGRYEPRWKGSRNAEQDAQWQGTALEELEQTNPDAVQRSDDGWQVDIANLPLPLLPPSWQEENRASARDVLGDVVEHLTKGGSLSDEAFRQRAASLNHDRWVVRNAEWIEDAAAKGDPTAPVHLLKAFDTLPQIEKDKDLDVVDTGIVAVRSFLADLSPVAAHRLEPSETVRTPSKGLSLGF